MHIVSYATSNYSDVYDTYLGKSIKALGIKNHAHVVLEPRKTWELNTCIKPEVILSQLKLHPSVLYTDADSTINSLAVLRIDQIVPKEYAGAFVQLPHRAWYGSDTDYVEPLAGTIFFRDWAIRGVQDWIKYLMKHPSTDNVAFEKVFGHRKEMFHLPIEWCYINTLPYTEAKGGIPCVYPLITHYQSSRIKRYL